jgi:N utilization substance protein B
MEVQDKGLLKDLTQQTLKEFEHRFEGGVHNPIVDERISTVLSESYQQYDQHTRKDTSFLLKQLVLDVEKIYDIYIAVLNLAVAFAKAAAGDKRINHKLFIENAWIQAFTKSDTLELEGKKRNRDWSTKFDVIRTWFKEIVRTDAEYLAYFDKTNLSFDDQKKFINHFFRKIILGKKTVINSYFEEEVLHWTEDKEIVRGMVDKTVKSFHPESQDEIQLHTLSVNWEDDRQFIETLFTKSNDLSTDHKDLIARNTRNWEVERLPLTDRIILEMAIVELINFPSIPVKVTINEYIELTKQYSTPKSPQFINGILDVIAKELQHRGELKKSGRGLIDNK